jgi:hypothetical protein
VCFLPPLLLLPLDDDEEGEAAPVEGRQRRQQQQQQRRRGCWNEDQQGVSSLPLARVSSHETFLKKRKKKSSNRSREKEEEPTTTYIPGPLSDIGDFIVIGLREEDYDQYRLFPSRESRTKQYLPLTPPILTSGDRASLEKGKEDSIPHKHFYLTEGPLREGKYERWKVLRFFGSPFFFFP